MKLGREEGQGIVKHDRNSKRTWVPREINTIKTIGMTLTVPKWFGHLNGVESGNVSSEGKESNNWVTKGDKKLAMRVTSQIKLGMAERRKRKRIKNRQ